MRHRFGDVYEQISDEKLLEWYVGAGQRLLRRLNGGEDLTLAIVEELDGHLKSLEIFEEVYSRRGFKPLAIQEFSLEGWELSERLKQRRAHGELAQLVAANTNLAELIASRQKSA
ncbi:MAG: hypothetical protein ACOYBJ_01780 [Patescibacteria group bacterium]